MSVCGICGEVFNNEHGLQIHKGKKHRYSCRLCSNDFTSEKGLHIHIGKMHSGRAETPSVIQKGHARPTSTQSRKTKEDCTRPKSGVVHTVNHKNDHKEDCTRPKSGVVHTVNHKNDHKEDCTRPKSGVVHTVNHKNDHKGIRGSPTISESGASGSYTDIKHHKKGPLNHADYPPGKKSDARKVHSEKTWRHPAERKDEKREEFEHRQCHQETRKMHKTYNAVQRESTGVRRTGDGESIVSPCFNESADAQKFVAKLEVDMKLQKERIGTYSTQVNRFIDRLYEIIQEESDIPLKILKSGSYYDKTKINKPDEFDFMFYPDIEARAIFDGPSGYCKIKVDNRTTKSTMGDVVNVDGFLVPQKFKDKMFRLFDACIKSPSFHPGRRAKRKERPPESPAFTVIDNSNKDKPLDIDLVPVIRITNWPDVACRIRAHWLDDQYCNDAMKEFHAVTKTYPGETRNKELYLRASFSHAEKVMILHANADGQSRKIIFKLLKQLMEPIKKSSSRKIEKFCSYHLKMFMLHFYDGKRSVWSEPKHVLLKQALSKLVGNLDKGHIENYFIRGDNILHFVPSWELAHVSAELKEILRQL